MRETLLQQLNRLEIDALWHYCSGNKNALDVYRNRRDFRREVESKLSIVDKHKSFLVKDAIDDVAIYDAIRDLEISNVAMLCFTETGIPFWKEIMELVI